MSQFVNEISSCICGCGLRFLPFLNTHFEPIAYCVQAISSGLHTRRFAVFIVDLKGAATTSPAFFTHFVTGTRASSAKSTHFLI